MISAVISSLHVYPVKSCRGLSLTSAELMSTGLRHDRRWMVVNAQGKFLTQRELSSMALVEPELEGTGLRVRAPGMPLLEVSGVGGPSVTVTVWKDTCAAMDEGECAAAWFSQYLTQPARLVRFDDTVQRLSASQWTGDIAAANQFSDGFPMLVISQASLDDLNARLPESLPMNRFRPNIVLSGVAPYAEDDMLEFGAGGWRLRMVKPCTRCKITTTDQATGVVASREPLSTLMGYRRNRQLQGVTFGHNAVISAGIGATLHVGDELAVSYRSAG